MNAQKITYEDIFGVQVDSRVPLEDKKYLTKQFYNLLSGDHIYDLSKPHDLISRMEHQIKGSGTGTPPDPFRIMASFGTEEDLELVRKYLSGLIENGYLDEGIEVPQGSRVKLSDAIEARRQHVPKEEKKSFIAVQYIENFEALTGLDPYCHGVIMIVPDVDSDGRVPMPEVTGIYDLLGGKDVEIDLGSDTLKNLKFITSVETKLQESIIREIFDYDSKQYQIDFVE